MGQLLVNVLGLLFISLIPALANVVPIMHFRVKEIDKSPFSLINMEVKMRSVGQCAGICLQQFKCLGYCYEPSTKICRVTNSNLTAARAAAVSAPGVKMYWPDYLDDFLRYGEYAYQMFHDPVTHTVAKSTCQSLGAQLTVPHNAQQIMYIMDAAGWQSTWINLEDTVTEGVFINGRTGLPATFLVWYGNEPNGGTAQNCLILHASSSYADISCSNGVKFTCERFVYGNY